MAIKDELLQKVRALLPEGAVCVDEVYRTGVVFAAQVPADQIRQIVQLCSDVGYFLDTMTAIDFEDGLELVYHVNCYEPKARACFRVLFAHGFTPPTISDIYPGASWLDREVHDFYGIVFRDNPDLRPLLMYEDADCYPLLKTYGTVHAYHRREEIYG
jgi:NADH-quinone oxidoreductase subunit C